MSWYDYIPSVAAYNAVKNIGHSNDQNNKTMDAARAGLNQQAGAAGNFANLGQGNYDTATGQLGNTYGQLGDAMGYLRGQMSGQNSVSAEQLRQGNQQAMSAQRSMAASASPQNAAMAARTGAIQMGRLSTGLAGQQALAGLQERNQAAQQFGALGSALGQLQLGARGQDVNVANGARGNAIQGYGGILNGQQNQNWFDKYGKQVMQGVGMAAGAA